MATKHQIGLAWTAIDRLRSVSHWVDSDAATVPKPQWSGPTENGKAWFDLTAEQIAKSLERYVPWDGFSGEEKALSVQNVIADTSSGKQMDGNKWMEGIVPEQNDYERMLDEAAERARYHQPDMDRGGPER
jgi:hypothetical protein